MLDTVSATRVVEPCALVVARVLVITTTAVVGTTLAVAVTVSDVSVGTPSEVTLEVRTSVVVDWPASSLTTLVVGLATTDDVVGAADDPPVDKLTCLFCSLASAASTSSAGTAGAEINAKRKKVEMDHLCILQNV